MEQDHPHKVAVQRKVPAPTPTAPTAGKSAAPAAETSFGPATEQQLASEPAIRPRKIIGPKDTVTL